MDLICVLDQACQFNFKRSVQQINGYDSLPHHISAGDFNEDGHLDIVVANSGTDNIGVLLNDQNGKFIPQITYSTGVGSRPYSVGVGYANNDTHLDVVVANYGTNSIGVLFGDSDGSFASPIITPLGSSRPLSLAVGYLNNDRLLDIAVVNYGTATILVLLGTNDGSFRIDNSYDMGYDSIPYALVLVDFNQDNTIDIIAVNYGTSELVILFNDGNASFVIEKYWTGAGFQPSSVTTGDFNNDTRLDIAVAYSGSSSIGIFLGNENRSLTNLMTYPLDVDTRPQFIDVGDFNNGTILDLVLIDSEYNNAMVLQGYGNGSFTIVTRHSTGPNSDPSSLIVGDFDNDQKLDVAITNNGTNQILVLTSYLRYPVAVPRQYITGNDSEPMSIDIADFNEDNYLDIVVSNYYACYVSVFLNLGNGSFANQQTYNIDGFSYPYFVVTADINNDHHADIVVALSSIRSVGLLLGSGNGSFIYGNTLPTYEDNSYLRVVAVDDFDNDGNLDIITVNVLISDLSLFFGFGDGTFTDASPLLVETDFYPNFVVVGDFNNDSILDIVVSNNGNGSLLAILLGYGNRTFQGPIFISTDRDSPKTFTIDDLDNDHRLDIVYTSDSSNNVGILFGNGDGTFKTVIKYSTESGPCSVDFGYYNDDTFIDMAVSNTLNDSISIYLGTENGSFGAPTRLSTGFGSQPWYVMFNDFNNDHQQDIAVVNYGTNNMMIFLVHFEADFINEVTYTTGSGSHPVSVSIGDLDNDGQTDIVVANSGNDNIEVLLRYNNGIFINTTVFSTGLGSHPQSVTIADFNRDHSLDIAVVDHWTNNMNVFVGLGNGSFDTRNIYSTGPDSVPNSIAAGDLNNDGRIDVVIANQGADNVNVFLAFDYVSFVEYMVGLPGVLHGPYNVATGDFNNDHLLDIAVAYFGSFNLGIYLGYGNGSFSIQITYASSPNSLTVGDLNNDNYLDIVTVNQFGDTIGVFLGYGNGSFQSEVLYSTGSFSLPISVAIADINNDSYQDIVTITSYTNNIWVFWGYGNGSFEGEIVYWMVDQSNPMWVDVGDLNNDNIPDIVVANNLANNLCILFGYSNGSFENVTMLSTGQDSQPYSVALGDFNRDQSIDIVVTNKKSKCVSVFFGYGNGAFSSQKMYPVNSDADVNSIVVSDINNDTFLDILVVDYNSANSGIGIFYGFGDGNFTLAAIYPTGLNSRPYSITTGDLNNDGKFDLVVNYLFRDSISVFIQMNNKPFAASASFSIGNQSQAKSVALGDFNNDNYLDIAVTNSAFDNIGILFGYGNGDFADQLTYSTGKDSFPSSISVGHFNDDHYLDIAVVNAASDTIGIFLGYGNGRFTNIIIYSTGFRSVPVAIAIDDLNKDKHLDLVVANSGSNDIRMFLGNGNGSFSELISYSLGYGARPQSVAIGDINHDDKLDIVVANNGTNRVEILLQTC